MRFDRRRRVFELVVRHDPRVSAPTEIFVPEFQYPRGYLVAVSAGSFESIPAAQTLAWRHGGAAESQRLEIRPKL
jgi:hypothetical protein